MQKVQFSVVIPCYNEEKNIPLLLQRFKEALAHEHHKDSFAGVEETNVEVILVDNGSKDDTASMLSMLLPQYSFARSVRVDVNQGYGHGILAGLAQAQGEFIGWTHADMQTDPQDVLRAFHIIQINQYNPKLYIKGKRRGRAWVDELFTKGMGIFESVYLKQKLWDINAQPNIFHQSFYQSWKNAPKDFSLDLYVLYKARRMKLDVIRFPVFQSDRMYGQSSWNTSLAGRWRFIKRTLDFSKKLKRFIDHE